MSAMEGGSVTASLVLAFLLGLLAGLAIDTSSPLVSWTQSGVLTLTLGSNTSSDVTVAAGAANNSQQQSATNHHHPNGHVTSDDDSIGLALEEISLDGVSYKDDRLQILPPSDEDVNNRPAAEAVHGISIKHVKSLLASNHFLDNGQTHTFARNTGRAVQHATSRDELLYESSRSVVQPLNGSYWSSEVEQLLTSRFEHFYATSPTLGLAADWSQTVRRRRVVEMREGCGRMQNRLLVFDDGSRACARYRVNVDQIQGDVFACHFARHLLGLANALPCVLSLPDPSLPSGQWLLVGDQLAQAQWSPRKAVVLTPWVDHLQPTFIPTEFRVPFSLAGDNADSSHVPAPVLAAGDDKRVAQLLKLKTDDELVELAQWSDLIVFDYVTANLDRVVNNLHNLQWNPAMLDSPAHNLERWTEGGLLVFVDNESGFFHGYRLLDRYAPYHSHLLNTTCLYRQATAQRLQQLCDGGNAGDVLMKTFTDKEPLHKLLPLMPSANKNVFHNRLQDVCNHLLSCRTSS